MFLFFKRNKRLYIILLVVVIFNLIQLSKLRKLQAKTAYYLEVVERMKKNETKTFHDWQKSMKLVGNKIDLSDFDLLEEISMNKITPVFCISRDVCSSCKDDFLKVLEGLGSKNIINKYLKLVFFDEDNDSIGAANQKYIRTFADLYFVKSETFNIEGFSRLPDIFVILINSEMNIISFYEYQVGHGTQLELYFKAINGNL